MTRWLEANGVALRYVDRGQGWPTLALLHEMGGCLESWDPLLAVLGLPLRTVAFDMRGAGLSEKPVGAFRIDDLADDLAGLLDGLDLDHQVVLVGCAVGAAVAIRLAAGRPERVAGLVLMAPATGLAPERRPEILALADRIEAGGLRPRILERFDTSYPAHYFEGRADRMQVRARLLQTDPVGYAQAYRMLCDMDLTPDLARIGAPTLILAGAGDKTRAPEFVQATARAIAGARFAVIPSGHAMHVLTPDLIASQIADFLSEHRLLAGGSPENYSIKSHP